jgi:hypothetical protein
MRHQLEAPCLRKSIKLWFFCRIMCFQMRCMATDVSFVLRYRNIAFYTEDARQLSTMNLFRTRTSRNWYAIASMGHSSVLFMWEVDMNFMRAMQACFKDSLVDQSSLLQTHILKSYYLMQQIELSSPGIDCDMSYEQPIVFVHTVHRTTILRLHRKVERLLLFVAYNAVFDTISTDLGYKDTYRKMAAWYSIRRNSVGNSMSKCSSLLTRLLFTTACRQQQHAFISALRIPTACP